MANIEERLVELINLASVETDGAKKVEYMYQIKELAVNHGLLDRFFDDILAFQCDAAPNVKKFILAFIESACKHDFKFCPKSILSLNLLLNDTNNDLIKRSTQVATHFYKALVQWIVDTQSQPQEPNTWLMWLQIQSLICNLLESTNNDGVRTHCIKFIETVILMQTPGDKDTGSAHKLNLIDPVLTPIRLSKEASMCGVAGLPKNGVLFDQEHKLELVEAAKKCFEQLVAFHGTSHISSVNLMATMQSLVVLAKQRYRLFMGRVIQAMESLHNRLPPTLTESQVQSVKKFLKLQLTVLLKHPYSLDRYQLQLSQLLQAVGSKQPEIHKVINEYKTKFGCDAPTLNNNLNPDLQKRIKLEPGSVKTEQKPFIGSQANSGQGVEPAVGKSKHLDLNKLTQELDEKEKRQIVVDSVRRILGDEKCINISPAQMDIKKKVLATLVNEFGDTECPQIIQDYIFCDLKNRHEICYAIIKKTYEIAEAKAKRRQIDLTDELLKDYFDCYSSYLSRAMELKDNSDREIILPNLYALKNKFYSKTGVEMDEDK